MQSELYEVFKTDRRRTTMKGSKDVTRHATARAEPHGLLRKLAT